VHPVYQEIWNLKRNKFLPLRRHAAEINHDVEENSHFLKITQNSHCLFLELIIVA
jgi:hypothetical protein